MLAYKAVWVKPNKTEEVVGVAETLVELPNLLMDPKWAGTWLSQTRKLLRYGRGELQIREELMPPHVVNSRIIVGPTQTIYELLIENHPHIITICAINDLWVAYNCLYSDFRTNTNIVFKTRSLTELAELIGKELAYDCYSTLESLTTQHTVKGAS